MNWLKRSSPLILSQSSDLPYVILEEGVKLFFDNCYDKNPKSESHFIKFLVNKKSVLRQSSLQFKFKKFPTTIPFEHIVNLDNTIVEGHIIKTASEKNDKSKSLCVVKSEYVRNLDDKEFQDFVDIVADHDKTFLLVNDDPLDPQSRLLTDISNVVYHNNWHRTSVHIADSMCTDNFRKYCWTKSLPELYLNFYGLQDTTEMGIIEDAMRDIGVQDFSHTWNE